jgi:hypothetical protein
MIAGVPNKLVLDSGDPNIALDGALVYGMNSTGARAGSFQDNGGTFANFSGCGTNAQGQIAGVVHKQLISCFVSLLHPSDPKQRTEHIETTDNLATDTFAYAHLRIITPSSHMCRQNVGMAKLC